MKDFCAFFSFFFLALTLPAQERVLELSSERRDDKSVEVSYTKTAPGSFTIVLDFSEYTNADKPQDLHTVNGSSGTLLTLKPKDKDQHIAYRYSYRYIRGKLKPMFDQKFCYLLPYAAGTKCEVSEAGFVNEQYFGAKMPEDWKSYYFYTPMEKPVTAARKGIVVEIVDQFEHSGDVAFTTKKNQLIIEHEDGTLMRYLGFKKGSFTVKPGDEVFPGTALGQNTLVSKTRYGISLFLYYLKSTDFKGLTGQTLSTPKSLYGIITPAFLTADKSCATLENRSSYESVSTEEIITKEMSKRELKKYKGK